MLLVCACDRSTPSDGTAGSGAGRAHRPAPRIVSLTPSATEVVAALDATPDLVGVDDFSPYPPEVKKLPKVGSFLTPNLEAIVRLRPSLVIVDDVHGSTAGALHDANIPTIECAIHALPDVEKALRAVGAKLGRAEQADRVVHRIERALDRAAAHRPTGKRPRVLAVIDREAGGLGGLVAAGPGSWLDELLAVVGGDNVLASSGIRYPKLSMEEVLRERPEVILDVSYAGEQSGAGAWDSVDVPAVQAKRVRVLPEQYLRAPSPRVEQALDALAKAIAP